MVEGITSGLHLEGETEKNNKNVGQVARDSNLIHLE